MSAARAAAPGGLRLLRFARSARASDALIAAMRASSPLSTIRTDDYVAQHPHAGGDLCDRGDRPGGGARPVRPDQSGAGGVLRLGAYAVGLGTTTYGVCTSGCRLAVGMGVAVVVGRGCSA